MTSLSQNFSKANAEVEKLEFNSRQSEVACDVVGDYLFYFKNKKVLGEIVYTTIYLC
jgi:hypothetical protein